MIFSPAWIIRAGFLYDKIQAISSLRINGAEASAVIYSITETAMLNGLRPYHYLTFVLDSMRKLPDFPTENQIRALLTWSPELPEECRVQLKK